MPLRFVTMAGEAKDQLVAAGSFFIGSAAVLQWLTEFAGLAGAALGVVAAGGAIWLLRKRLEVVEIERKLRVQQLDNEISRHTED